MRGPRLHIESWADSIASAVARRSILVVVGGGGAVWSALWAQFSKGLSIKYVTLEGEGVREDVSVCDRGGVKEHVTSRLYIFYLTYET